MIAIHAKHNTKVLAFPTVDVQETGIKKSVCCSRNDVMEGEHLSAGHLNNHRTSRVADEKHILAAHGQRTLTVLLPLEGHEAKPADSIRGSLIGSQSTARTLCSHHSCACQIH